MDALARAVCAYTARTGVSLPTLIKLALGEYLKNHSDDVWMMCEKIEERYCDVCHGMTEHCVSGGEAVCLVH